MFISSISFLARSGVRNEYHVLLDELAHCVLQVGIKQLVAAGFGHIGLRFPEKRFKSYHYFRDFPDVPGIRNDYPALFGLSRLSGKISERIVHAQTSFVTSSARDFIMVL